MRWEAAPRGDARWRPATPDVEADSTLVLVEHPKRNHSMPLGPQMVEDLLVRLPGQPTAPRRDRSAEVEQFVRSRRSEPSKLRGIDDGEAVDARIGELSPPPVQDPLFRKGVRLLREDMAEPRHGALALYDKQGAEIVLGERLQHSHGSRVSSCRSTGRCGWAPCGRFGGPCLRPVSNDGERVSPGLCMLTGVRRYRRPQQTGIKAAWRKGDWSALGPLLFAAGWIYVTLTYLWDTASAARLGSLVLFSVAFGVGLGRLPPVRSLLGGHDLADARECPESGQADEPSTRQ